jgi:hypothetical protein
MIFGEKKGRGWEWARKRYSNVLFALFCHQTLIKSICAQDIFLEEKITC